MRLAIVGSILAAGSAIAQVPAILIEACSQMEPAAKRVECLQAANQVPARVDHAASIGAAAAPQLTTAMPTAPVAPAAPSAPLVAAPRPSVTATSPSSATCFVGPRGGTYTITRSGKKNYSGC